MEKTPLTEITQTTIAGEGNCSSDFSHVEVRSKGGGRMIEETWIIPFCEPAACAFHKFFGRKHNEKRLKKAMAKCTNTTCGYNVGYRSGGGE